MERNATLARRRTRRDSMDYGQSAGDRVLRETFAALADAAGRVVHPAQYEIGRSDPRGAGKPWAKLMDIFAANFRYARALPASQRHQVRLAVRRIMDTMEALILAEDMEHNGCHTELHVSESRHQERVDEAQFAHYRDPDCVIANERLLAAISTYTPILTDLQTFAAFKLTHARAR